MKTWQEQVDEGRQAFLANPHTSLRGKSDGFRQGFYAQSFEALQSKAGYTHKIKYDVYSKTLEMWVSNEFAIFADSIRRYRRDVAKQGGKNIVVTPIQASKGN